MKKKCKFKLDKELTKTFGAIYFFYISSMSKEPRRTKAHTRNKQQQSNGSMQRTVFHEYGMDLNVVSIVVA